MKTENYQKKRKRMKKTEKLKNLLCKGDAEMEKVVETEAVQGGDSEMEKMAETEEDEVEADEVEPGEENSKNDEEPEEEVEEDKNSKNDDSNPLRIVETVNEIVNETVDYDKLNLGNINLFYHH